MQQDPLLVSSDLKIARLLEINEAALKAGANYRHRFAFGFVREEKFFASSRGSAIEQVRTRVLPETEVTVIDKATGKFASVAGLAAPRGAGYDYLLGYDFVG